MGAHSNELFAMKKPLVAGLAAGAVAVLALAAGVYFGTTTQPPEPPSPLLGLALPDDNAHSPNEKFSLDCYARGMRMSACLWRELASR